MKANFLIDQHMIEHNEQDILSILKESYFEVRVGKYIPLAKGDEIPQYFKNEECVIVYGSMEFVKQQQSKGYVPGAYSQLKNLECVNYISNLDDPSILLNDEHVMITFSELCRRPNFFFKALNAEEIFIRPNSGQKIFTGCVLRKDNFDSEILSLKQLTSISHDTLILVSPAQKIKSEYRIAVVNRDVVAASRYQLNGEISLSKYAPLEVIDTARKIAQNTWQPDIAYIVDIAVTDNGSKVLELNAISTSGLYMMNLPKMFKSWSDAAFSEFSGELSLGDLTGMANIFPKIKF